MMTADLVLSHIDARSKKQAFQLIAEEAEPLLSVSADDLLRALLERERIGATGIGHGVAIPHVKVAGIEKTYAILAHLKKPVDYDALDEKPVDIIFMLLAPADSKTTGHLKMLAQISRFLKDEKNRAHIRGADETADIKEHLQNWIAEQAA